ncbi:hypothetical protein [Secundilactobacillus oryzae]|uniref:hypothetical protein n=1 Tax=Secundilactobacillus oryzae TaxID=1202668 RepID=UPI0020934690|nr:hypothetical protein [Secundilactobacillus oryzae]
MYRGNNKQFMLQRLLISSLVLMGITVGGELTAQADTNYSNVSGTETTSANAAQPDEKN